MFRYAGSCGNEESIVTPEEGDDSASKRAWRTAESLVVREGLEGLIVAAADILAVFLVLLKCVTQVEDR